MKFDFQSDIPLFQQVANQLEEEIFHEVYKEGDQVPSTTEIFHRISNQSSNGIERNELTRERTNT